MPFDITRTVVATCHVTNPLLRVDATLNVSAALACHDADWSDEVLPRAWCTGALSRP